MAQIPLSGSIGVPGSIAVLGNVAIVMSNVAHTMSPAEYSNKFIEVTSSVALTGTQNLIGPLTQGQEFIIQNKTTGGQSIQIIASSGVGVTIPTGVTVAVVCDGINYIIQSGTGSGAPNASIVTYNPANPGGWPFPPPTVVSDALDTLIQETGTDLPSLPGSDGYYDLRVLHGDGYWVPVTSGSVDASAVTYEPGVPGNWPVPPTEVAQALDDLAANSTTIPSLVFRPGGIASENIYTSEADIATASQSFNGAPYTIFFDFSMIGGPFSTYTVATVGAWNLAPNGSWTDGGEDCIVQFSNNTTLIDHPNLDGSISIYMNQTTTVVTQSTNAIRYIRGTANITFPNSNSGYWCDSGSATLYLVMQDESYVEAGSGLPSLYNVSSGVIEVYVEDQGYFGDSSLGNVYIILVDTDASGNSNTNGIQIPSITSAFTTNQLLASSYYGHFILETTGQIYWSSGSSWRPVSGPGAGLPGAPGTDGNYELQVSSGTPNWVGAVPSPPGTDGYYELKVNSGVSSWIDIEIPNPPVFVFQPGGTQSGNTYTTEAALSVAMTNSVRAILIFDLSHYSSNIYHFFIGTFNFGYLTTWTDLGSFSDPPFLYFTNNTQLTYPPYRIEGQIIIFVNQGPHVFTDTSNFTGASLHLTDGASIQITSGSTGSFIYSNQPHLWTVGLTGTSNIVGTSSAPALLFNNSSASITCNVGDASELGMYAIGAISIFSTILSFTGSSILGANATPTTGSVDISIFGTNVEVNSSNFSISTLSFYGIYYDITGLLIQNLPASQANEAMVFDPGNGIWFYSNGTDWIAQRQTGRATLINGTVTVTTAFPINTDSRIMLAYAAVNASTSLGVLVAPEVSRTTGTFIINSLIASSPLTLNVGDQSDVEWTVIPKTQ